MKRVFIYISLVLMLGAAGYYGVVRYNAVQHSRVASLVGSEDPDQRLKTLYAQQDALYRGRYGHLDAEKDIDGGTPKLLWSGLPRAYDGQWVEILHERFSVKAEFIAGCEASASLMNYADAYNATVEKYIAKTFGVDALSRSQDEAMRISQLRQTTESNQSPQPPRPKGG